MTTGAERVTPSWKTPLPMMDAGSPTRTAYLMIKASELPLLVCPSNDLEVLPVMYIDPSTAALMEFSAAEEVDARSRVHAFVPSLLYLLIKASIPPLLVCPSSDPKVNPAM